ncbi:MAG: TrbI F-type domain-containing protein [Pseudomonadota bacterium]
MTDVPTPSFKSRILWAALALSLASLLWLAILTKTVSEQRAPVIVTVSLKTILERHIERLGGDDLTSVELQYRSDAYVAALEQVISHVSQDEDVIVLVSEAVVSDGVIDLTEDVERLAGDLLTPTEARNGD